MIRVGIALLKRMWHMLVYIHMRQLQKNNPQWWEHRGVDLCYGRRIGIWIPTEYKYIGCICGKCFYKGKLTPSETSLLERIQYGKLDGPLKGV